MLASTKFSYFKHLLNCYAGIIKQSRYMINPPLSIDQTQNNVLPDLRLFSLDLCLYEM